MTRGRVAMGIGPGALNSDGHMLGIDHSLVRERMEESLDIIIRLLTEPDPFTYKSDWFELVDGHVQLQPYTKPYFEIASASAQSPTGMKLAGKHGLTPLSLTFARSPGGFYHNTLKDLWEVAAETGEKYGHKMDRSKWGLVMHVFLADTRKEAIEIARHTSGLLMREYFEKTLGMAPTEGPSDKIIDKMVEDKVWCIGTPDDLIEMIHRLDDESGGFGSLILLATEVGTKEQVNHSYELIARYVMPQFQGTTNSLQMSQQFFADLKEEMADQREKALDKAGKDYKTQS
jgi:limonene 1,2-monooxygenase